MLNLIEVLKGFLNKPSLEFLLILGDVCEEEGQAELAAYCRGPWCKTCYELRPDWSCPECGKCLGFTGIGTDPNVDDIREAVKQKFRGCLK